MNLKQKKIIFGKSFSALNEINNDEIDRGGIHIIS